MATWEFTYNGLTFGGSTDYGVLQVQGLEPPEAKADIREKVSAHGAFVFAQYYMERRIIIEGDILPSSGTLESKVNTWRTTFANRTADANLDYTLPGEAVRRIKCRPVRRVCTIDMTYGLGYAHWTVELVAGDPAIYNTSDVKVYDA